MPERTIEDLLREEYLDLLPEIRLAADHLKAEISYQILPIVRSLRSFERVEVDMRVKECASAVESLKRRQDANSFQPELSGKYTITHLRDLAGVRVLAFPRSRLNEIDSVLRQAEAFKRWTADPVLGDSGATLAFKYFDYCPASSLVRGEYQIVSILTGLFWKVEHSAIYKPSAELRDVAEKISMQNKAQDVLAAFEEEFERLLRARTADG